MDISGDSKRGSLVWVGKLDCPDAEIEATAVLVSASNTEPLGIGGRLRLLTIISLDTVPCLLFTPTVFSLFINSKHTTYINGLVNRLLPPMQEALLVKIEGATDGSLADPFAQNTINPWALVYVDPGSSSRLAMHVLDKSLLGSLANVSKNTSAAEDTSLEHEFIAQLATLDQPVPSNSLPATLTAKFDTPKPQPATNNSSSSSSSSPVDGSAQPTEQIEQANKQLAKQLIIASLKSRRIGRDHKDFAALWGQIYRSLKFAMRDKLSCKLTVKSLRAQVEKHTAFYLN
ncbi:hypothetical protein EV183_003631 [Coemansia sp. RSA 2336]|nr:hypothetical protein EV183_003631 [Coemansia sp. RSA 2336]